MHCLGWTQKEGHRGKTGIIDVGIRKAFKIPIYMPGKNRTPNDNKQREKNQGKKESIYETIKEKHA